MAVIPFESELQRVSLSTQSTRSAYSNCASFVRPPANPAFPSSKSEATDSRMEGRLGFTRPAGVEYWSPREKLACSEFSRLLLKLCTQPALAWSS